MTDSEDDEPVDWTGVTGRLLLNFVPEDKREEAAGFLEVYRQDVRAATVHDVEVWLRAIIEQAKKENNNG